MLMMTSEILKSVGFTKTQNLKNETLFFLQRKKIINYTSNTTYFVTKNSFVMEVTINNKRNPQVEDRLVYT